MCSNLVLKVGVAPVADELKARVDVAEWYELAPSQETTNVGHGISTCIPGAVGVLKLAHPQELQEASHEAWPQSQYVEHQELYMG